MDKTLVARWLTTEGQLKTVKILELLRKNSDLSNIGLEKYLGRWDLRGFQFPIPELKRKIRKDAILTTAENIVEIKKTKLRDIDLSFSNMSFTQWHECSFQNSIFENVKATNIKFWACDFSNTQFVRVNFKDGLLGGRIGRDSGSFTDTEFIQCSFIKTSYSFPSFNRCRFEHCELDEVDFDGSRFDDCKFVGKLDATIFRGKTTDTERRHLFEFKIDAEAFPNKMKNTNFTEATLVGVSFIDGIDISTCKFPINDDYILVKNISEVFKKASGHIHNEWSGSKKEIALNMINLFYCTEHHRNQLLGIVDKTSLSEQFGKEFSDDFFKLLKNVNDEVGTPHWS